MGAAVTGDLAAFLAARLDEDEAVAKLAAREGSIWTQDDPDRYPGAISSLGGIVVYDEGAPDENQAPHIARHDPARVLREVAAKRTLLRYFTDPQTGEPVSIGIAATATDLGRNRMTAIPGSWILRELAAVYSDHPDYRQEWAP